MVKELKDLNTEFVQQQTALDMLGKTHEEKKSVEKDMAKQAILVADKRQRL